MDYSYGENDGDREKPSSGHKIYGIKKKGDAILYFTSTHKIVST